MKKGMLVLYIRSILPRKAHPDQFADAKGDGRRSQTR
jgi:hypothetical protein